MMNGKPYKSLSACCIYRPSLEELNLPYSSMDGALDLQSIGSNPTGEIAFLCDMSMPTTYVSSGEDARLSYFRSYCGKKQDWPQNTRPPDWPNGHKPSQTGIKPKLHWWEARDNCTAFPFVCCFEVGCFAVDLSFLSSHLHCIYKIFYRNEKNPSRQKYQNTPKTGINCIPDSKFMTDRQGLHLYYCSIFYWRFMDSDWSDNFSTVTTTQSLLFNTELVQNHFHTCDRIFHFWQKRNHI